MFPILLLFGRLFPSLDESKLDKFIFLLDACSASPIISIRKAAAKAFATILPTGKQASRFARKMKVLSALGGTDLSSNAIHGLLLQVQAVLDLQTYCEEFKESVTKTFNDPELFLQERCSVVAALYLDLLMRLRIRQPEALRIKLSEFSAEGHCNLQRLLTQYQCELG